MSIKLTNVSKIYQLKNTSFAALESLTLTLPEHSFTCIVGKSGCGKTTLLRLLAGLEPVSSGNISFDRVQPKIGFVFQEPRLMPWLTVSENITFSSHSNPNLIASSLDLLLKLLGLQDFATAYPHQLSGGMAQRVALGRTLFQNPDIILMDEPFSSLDYFTRHSLQQTLLNLFKEQRKTVVFVTHDVEEAIILGEQVLIMQNGSIKANLPITLPTPRITTDSKLQTLRQNILDILDAN